MKESFLTQEINVVKLWNFTCYGVQRRPTCIEIERLRPLLQLRIPTENFLYLNPGLHHHPSTLSSFPLWKHHLSIDPTSKSKTTLINTLSVSQWETLGIKKFFYYYQTDKVFKLRSWFIFPRNTSFITLYKSNFAHVP